MAEHTPQDATVAVYLGAPGYTQKRLIHCTCSGCGALFAAHVYSAVNVAADPAVGERLWRGELNTPSCPRCETTCAVGVPLVYHDPAGPRFALLLPETLRHEELEARADLLRALAADGADVPDYVRRADVVFGTIGLQRLIEESASAASALDGARKEAAELTRATSERRAELERREEEVLGREEDLQAKQEDLVAGLAKLEQARQELAQKSAELEREREALRALAIDLQGRGQSMQAGAPEQDSVTLPGIGQPGVPLPGGGAGEHGPVPETRPQPEVDRWRAGEDRLGYLIQDKRVVLLARPGPQVLPSLLDGRPSLGVQLFTLAGVSLVNLVVLPAKAKSEEQTDAALFWTLDPCADPDRSLLEQLAADCRLSLDLYDDEARAMSTCELASPLAENVRWILQRVPRAPSDPARFAVARQAFQGLGEERLGRKQHNFASDSFSVMASPAAARLALGIVSYWSQAENEDYLIAVKSFPLVHWRAIRERVVRRAIDLGLRLSPELSACALELKLAGSIQELLRSLVAAFAEVSLRIRPSDLDPGQEWDNWKLLLADCVQNNVQVDHEIEELAAVAARRVGSENDPVAPGGDLGLLAEDALLELLEDRDQRRDAAMELCERGSGAFLEPVYAALCNMSRSEAVRVIPAMVRLGADAVPFLVQGLQHRKSFIRQGCALALGALKAAAALEPLIDMLLGEPTSLWQEAARAIGDIGAVALGGLIASLKTADASGRERIASAMAHAALSPALRTEVEAMARETDARLARAATRALELIDSVRAADQAVRGVRPSVEQTVVRSFSRRFYECLALESSELAEGDIVEQEEVLDEGDIVDEEVEVHEDDILRQTDLRASAAKRD